MNSVVAGVVTVAMVIGAVAFALWNNYGNGQQHMQPPSNNVPEQLRIGKCVICNKYVSDEDSDKSRCRCVRHKRCMKMLVEEGQLLCPGCRTPLL